MITRDELRVRMAKIGIGPTLLGEYSGALSIGRFLSGRAEEIPDLDAYRVEDTLVACEQLSAEVGIPIHWQNMADVNPRLAKYLQTLSQRRLAETNKAELRQMHSAQNV